MNTIFKSADGKWYFWDETETYDYGPYDTEQEAMAALKEYCIQLMSN